MVHSFFAVMGGYAIELRNPFFNERDFLPDGLYGSPRLMDGSITLSLTSAAILRLAQLHPSSIPRLTLQSIRDRSKADSFTKILACVQAGYIIAQVVGRLANNLPVTMLEVNTIGHVFCALIIYSFWLKKPFAVEEPIYIIGSGEGCHSYTMADKSSACLYRENVRLPHWW
jgi:hypothetical protein